MSILSFLHSVWQAIVTFFVFISMMLSNVGASAVEFSAYNSDELVMAFSIISDVHVQTTDSSDYKNLFKVLDGIKGNKDNDAIVYLGDNVMNGQRSESLLFYSALQKFLPDENNFVVMGNHDIGNGEGDYNELCERFLENNSKYLDNDIEKPYYYKIVNGCYMIFLASEANTSNKCYMTPDQYFWLKGLLDDAAADEAPIFVFNHHPIHMLTGIEEYSLINLLEGYDNLYYFYGHTHRRLSEFSFRYTYCVRTINLPRVLGANYDEGDGIVVEVYEDEIVIRCRNFIKNEWIDSLERRYPIV